MAQNVHFKVHFTFRYDNSLYVSKSHLNRYKCDVIPSPLYLWQELSLEDAPGLQRLRDLSPEEEAPLGQINQNLPDDLAEVHATAHLLVSDMYKNETKLKMTDHCTNTTTSSSVCPLYELTVKCKDSRSLSEVLRLRYILILDVSWPLFAFVERVLVHRLVVLCPDVIQTAVVSKRPPLHIDTHTTLFSVHYLDVLHLLHVTGVTARPWEDTSPHPISPKTPPRTSAFKHTGTKVAG